MMKEHQRVVLTASFPSDGLEIGDIGSIVHVHGDGAGYEVEFVTLDGQSSKVLEVTATELRPVRAGELAHARPLAQV